MSTPIRQVEVSPDDPKFYVPPRWRRECCSAEGGRCYSTAR